MFTNGIIKSFQNIGIMSSSQAKPVSALQSLLNSISTANVPRAQQFYTRDFQLPFDKDSLLRNIHIPATQPATKNLSMQSMRNKLKIMSAEDQNKMSELVLTRLLEKKGLEHTHSNGFFKEIQPLSKQDLENIKSSFMNQRPNALITHFGGVKRNAVQLSKIITAQHNLQLQQSPRAEQELQLKNSIRDAVSKLQHNYFLENRDWTASDHTSEHNTFRNHFLQNHDFARLNSVQLDITLNEEFSRPSPGTVQPEGSRFKAHKALSPDYDGPRLLNATQIKSASGQMYRLLNTLETQDLQALAQQKNIQLPAFNGLNKHVFGSGGYGKVRLAQAEDGRLIAVKKFSTSASITDPKSAAVKEWAETSVIRDNGKDTSRLNLPLDFAHTKVMNKTTGQLEDKSYIFMELAEQGDGHQFNYKMRSLMNDPAQKQKYQNETMPFIAHGYIAATAQLHEHGLAHHDIKPANMLHFNTGIKLTDFGLTAKTDTLYTRGTRAYNPPELYRELNPALGTENSDSSLDPKKHDAFSIGMSILEMKLQSFPAVHDGPHLNINNQPVTLNFYKAGENGTVAAFFRNEKEANDPCRGTIGSKSLKGNTLDEVIAKLIDSNVHDRITPEEALKLPYFTEPRQSEQISVATDQHGLSQFWDTHPDLNLNQF